MTYVVLFLIGALVSGQINRGIYRLAWIPRPIGPWSPPHPDAPPRHWSDRLPIVGWWGLRRESPIHGRGYWVRPMMLELLCAAGLAVFYAWSVDRAGLMPAAVVGAVARETLYAQFAAQTLLIALMIVATFIDFDEQTIPDAITLPGTLAGLTLMTLWPSAAPPVLSAVRGGVVRLEHLLLTSPNPWPDRLDASDGLFIGLLCYAGWAFAVWPKTITKRRGLVKAVQYAAVSMFRLPQWWLMVLMLVMGLAGIGIVWTLGGESWRSLLTALVGVAFGGGLIWSVRLVGQLALGKEAMGFGDVTLMAMIGAFVGWQATLMIFFMAPFVAVFICLAQWLVTHRRDIAFGPYLCAATLVLILRWTHIWEFSAKHYFAMPWLPHLVFFCLILLTGLLRLWRIVERLITGES